MTAFSLRTSASLCALALVAACGGTTIPLPSGGAVFPGDNLLPAGGSGQLSLQEIATVGSKLAPKFNNAGITPKAAVPTSGGANYLGYVAGDLTTQNTVKVNGLMQMGVDFGNNRVGGTVGNFVTSGGEAINGNLTVQNGRLNRTLNGSQVTILGDVGGTLTKDNLSIGVNGEISDGQGRAGGFKGDNGEFIGIPMRGKISANGQPGTFKLNGVLGQTSR